MEKGSGSSSTAPSAAVNAVYAKTIILGDSQTGRSELISNLNYHRILSDDAIDQARGASSPSRKFNIVIDESNFFSTIELSPAEIEHPSMTAYLKVWEYTQHLSKKDEELAFRGALFCIVTFDICKVQSYRSVFEKWIPLKEQLSPDSFLYVVGTNADRHSYRQIELEEICKACAKKDAVYVEVSNANGANFQLLRRLLCCRVRYMLEQKDIFSSPAFQAKLKSSALNTAADRDEDSTARHKHSKAFNSGAGVHDISVPALEPNIMSNSVGSILSSFFDLEEWEGYEKQEQEMLLIADKIDAFVENLANTAESNIGDLHSLTMNDSFLSHDLSSLPPLERNLELAGAETEEQQHARQLAQSFQQLKEAFQILGLSMPESLLQSQPKEEFHDLKGDNGEQDPFALPNAARPNLRKMLVKLPGGHSAEMVLDLDSNLEQQIELFLMSNGLHYDLEARRKLLQTTTRVQRDYLESRRTMNQFNGGMGQPPQQQQQQQQQGQPHPSLLSSGGAFVPPNFHGTRSAPPGANPAVSAALNNSR